MTKLLFAPWRLAPLLGCAVVFSGCNATPIATTHSNPEPYPEHARQVAPYAQNDTDRPYDRYSHERGSRAGHEDRQRSSGNHTATDNTPGHFDYYLLDLSWSPEYCFSHRDAPECTTHAAFVLHGLWPQNTDSTYPENCSDAPGPSDPAQYRDLYPSAGLLEHEWHEHGSCSGLTAGQYVSSVRTALHELTIPPMLSHLTQQTTMSPDQVLTLFTQANAGLPHNSLALSCGHNYLTAVGVCMDKHLHPIACGELRSCRANVIRITPPQS